MSSHRDRRRELLGKIERFNLRSGGDAPLPATLRQDMNAADIEVPVGCSGRQAHGLILGAETYAITIRMPYAVFTKLSDAVAAEGRQSVESILCALGESWAEVVLAGADEMEPADD